MRKMKEADPGSLLPTRLGGKLIGPPQGPPSDDVTRIAFTTFSGELKVGKEQTHPGKAHHCMVRSAFSKRYHPDIIDISTNAAYWCMLVKRVPLQGH